MTAPDSTPAEAVAAVPDLVETVEELRSLLNQVVIQAFGLSTTTYDDICKALE